MALKISIKSLICLTFIMLLSSGLSAQKVKYKDLYVLLSANDFKQSEPFLRIFINNEPDHANANLYMGRLFEYKSQSEDVLTETSTFTAYCDSAVYYYRQAYTLIDEKEIKKNDEYYQDYSRRDLRTGKFGVKMADVKFDLEKRIGDTEKLSQNVKLLKEHFDKAVAAYSQAELVYINLSERFTNMTTLLLKSTDADVDSLKKIGELYDDFTLSFQRYKQTLNSVSGTEYNQKLVKKFLEGLIEIDSPDFYAEEVKVYDFKSWSDKTAKDIVDVINPMKENMSEYDRQLDELFRKVKEDTMTVESELATLTEKMLFEQLINYDTEPLPSLIFNYKVDEISYYSYYNHVLKEGRLDTTDIDYQIHIYNDLLEKYMWMYDAYNELAKVKVEDKSNLYIEFVTDRFGSVSKLVNYIAMKGEKVTEQETYLKGTLSELKERSNWGFFENDSIPLFLSDEIRLIPSDSIIIYKTLLVDSISDGYIAYGIKYNDGKPKNFFSKIGRDRMVDTLFLQIPKMKIQIDSMSRLESWSASYNDDQGFIIVVRVSKIADTGETVSGFEISNIEPGTGIKWTTPFENYATVKELNVDPSNGLIVIKMGQIAEGGVGTETENLVFNFKGALMTSLGN